MSGRARLGRFVISSAPSADPTNARPNPVIARPAPAPPADGVVGDGAELDDVDVVVDAGDAVDVVVLSITSGPGPPDPLLLPPP